MKFDKASMRARFHEAQAEKAAAEAAMQPLIDKRDALLTQMRPLEAQLKDVEAQLKVAREPIYNLSVEIGGIAKFMRDPDGKSRL